jgi:hypothetical protein
MVQVATVPPILILPPPRPVPVMVMVVPPISGPELGEMPVMVGAAM